MRAVAIGMLLVAGLVSAACSGEPERVDAPGDAAADDLRGDPARTCPRDLPRDPDDEFAFGTDEPADALPNPGTFERAWVCAYQLGDARGGWQRLGPVARIDDADLSWVRDAIEGLEVAPDDGACTDDLGPIYLVVTLRDSTDLTGYAADAFGCRYVRITDEPAETVPGEAEQDGTVPGVLLGGGALIEVGERYLAPGGG